MEESRIEMVVGAHPDHSKLVGKRYIGYWAADKDPAKCSYARKGISLPWPGDYVDTSWDPQERAAVVAYLESVHDVVAWCGRSYCRLGCAESIAMGSTDKGDGVYVWPEGFAHYVEVHGVKPPQEFIDHVRKLILISGRRLGSHSAR